MQYPTYMVMKRGVDALLDRRPHGLVQLLSFIPHKVNGTILHSFCSLSGLAQWRKA